ncbi:MAG: hypothetical protein QM727_10260 [Niabella sp.]
MTGKWVQINLSSGRTTKILNKQQARFWANLPWSVFFTDHSLSLRSRVIEPASAQKNIRQLFKSSLSLLKRGQAGGEELSRAGWLVKNTNQGER